MDEEAARKAERVKALLATYYGSGGDSAPAPQPDSQRQDSSSHALPRESYAAALPTMDSPAFDAERHIATMLKNSSLERLLVEHRNTAREIKSLDSDMQQLVYENYNKFISATDTIKAMKSQIGSVSSDMDKLAAIMDNVSDKSRTVSQKLQKRQDNMEQLHKVQNLLRKLQAVFDLPRRMRAALEEDVLDAAVSFYAEAQPLLRKYGHSGTFRHIATDSDQVAKEISQVLKRRLTERKDDTEQCVLLLRKLGEADDTLQDKYLQGRSQRLRKILKEATLVVDIMAQRASALIVSSTTNSSTSTSTSNARGGSGIGASKGPTLPPLPAQLLKQIEAPVSWGLQDGAVPNLKTFIKLLDEKVINAVQETVMNVTRFFQPLGQDGGPKGESAEALAARRKPLVVLAKEVFVDYFAIARRAIADAVAVSVYRAARVHESGEDTEMAVDGPHMEFLEEWGADSVAQALSALSTDLGLLSSSLPELHLKDRAAEVVTQVVRHHISHCFATLQGRVMGAVDMVRSRLSEQTGPQGRSGSDSGAPLLKRGYAYTTAVVQHGLSKLMLGLRSYEGHPRLLSSWHDEFMDSVQGGLQQFFLSLLFAALEVAGIKYDGSDRLREALKGPANANAQVSGPRVEFATPTSTTLVLPRTGAAATAPPPSASGPGPTKASEPPKSGLVLLLAKVCTFLEQQSVPWVMETIASSFVGRGGGRGGDLPPAFVPGEVGRRLNAASSALLASYVELHGRQLSLMVRRSVNNTNWLQHKEPRDRRPVCDLLGERLGRAETEVGQLVEDTGRRTDERAKPGGLSSAAAKASGFDAGLLLETGNVERNLAKIFRDKDKVKIFGTVQFTQANILAAIIGVCLKSLVEVIRLQTLGRQGLQQLQLDCHYLRPQLRRFTGARLAQVVDSLLDEVVAAAVERSTDPTLLEPAVLDKILTSADGTGAGAAY